MLLKCPFPVSWDPQELMEPVCSKQTTTMAAMELMIFHSAGHPHQPQPQAVTRRVHRLKHPLEHPLEMRSQQPGLAQQHQHVQHAVHMHRNKIITMLATT